MTTFEEIQKYLPKYLSMSETTELLKEIDEQFPEIHPTRVYTSIHDGEETIFQGDGIRNLLFVHLPSSHIQTFNCMVISNTCDIDLKNKNIYPHAICYAPIIRLDKYCQALLKSGKWTSEQIESHTATIKNQKLTTAFYLPRGSRLEADSMVLLDWLCHCDSKSVPRPEIPNRRIFTLSAIGAYLFMFKLSVHFLRMTDKVLRPII
jgi:hypothetical protein